jgi:phenylalanyl-tRNA synthetase alpha chain
VKAAIESLSSIEREAIKGIEEATSSRELDEVRIRYLGRKGHLTQILRRLGEMPVEERRSVGREANRLKALIGDKISERARSITLTAKEQEGAAAPPLDVTLPGKRSWLGRRHPLSRGLEELIDIFLRMGFSIAVGPDVEWDYYNFEALNMPAEHPARDMWSTFFITDTMLLRTHTSPVQIRVMEKQKPPVRIITPGRCFRVDLDASHAPNLHQIEGLYVDRDVTLGDLKGTLELFAAAMFGEEVQSRFVPSYFPFTEPSAEMYIGCTICGGDGCRVCHSGWVEILGCGMVDPAVFHAVGYDAEEWTGFAFGMGVERILMLKYRIDDIRLFYENDVRFLRQF